MAELVAGYAQILQSKDIISLEVSKRQKHLVSLICLMYFAQQFTWSAFLDKFHDAVLLEIERALIQWGDSFMHLERRTLYGHPVPETLTAKSSSFKSSPLPILFCRDYQPDAIPVFDLRNHRGAFNFPAVVEAYLTSDNQLGRVAGSLFLRLIQYRNAIPASGVLLSI